MKKIFVIGNWKCNPTSLSEAKSLFLSINKKIQKKRKIETVICPPFVYLFPLAQLNRNHKIILGAQDAFFENKGAFTGQVSPKMLKDLGCKYVIVGHSEKRVLGEKNEIINKKIHILLKENLTPILCIGENKEEREGKQTFERIKNQIQEGLKKVAKKYLHKVIIAYEPIWAIGTNRPCPPESVLTISIFIRKTFSTLFGLKKTDKITILYGGSVNANNAKKYVEEARIDGLLIGNSSLRAEEFLKIIFSFY